MKTTNSQLQADNLKNEAIGHLATYILLSIMFQVVFFREHFLVTQRLLLGIYWSMILPGTTLLLWASDRWGFVERVFAGTAVGMVVHGTLSYYLGILGLHVRYHGWLLPPLLIGAGILLTVLLRGEKNDG